MRRIRWGRICALWIMTIAFFGNPIFAEAEENAAKGDIAILGKVSPYKKYTMYLGTNDKDTGKQEIPTEIIKSEMHEICLKYVDGYTLFVTEGYYKNAKGNIDNEVSLVYVFLDTSVTSLKSIMDEALVKFNQSSILLEESDAESVFYSSSSIE